ncbi:serine hydrolase [Pedobacter petrophilus]|uniref:Serine hydrolase n=1 Tax=Pedobacter petrophilus TaxID=1908241 RepID=A0A7K0G6C7_9SPHI|nr:serine hydrolase domain-containing protein [Pedobacter petrophilus]MRX78759.1 serine hydrolase [Pedobacter petrophilus]
MGKWKLLMIVGLTIFSNIQPVFCQSHIDSLTNALKQVFETDSLPGMSVVLVDAKKVIYEHHFGYADVEKGVKYTSKSIQNIGSVSKTITAVALMKAIELGYFNLETDINTILPFKVVNLNYPTGKITIRQLSNHTSGIIDNEAVFFNTYHFETNMARYDTAAYEAIQHLGFEQKIEDSTLKDFMREYLSAGGKYYNIKNFGNHAPGASSSYSNIASALAAYLIEVKSGMTYAEFTSKYILKPLQMKNSDWFLNPHKLAEYARPYYNQHAVLPYYHFITYPDGGLRTNTADLAKYLMAMINGYNGDQKLLNQSSYQIMFTPQFSIENPPKGISLANRNKGIFWNLYNNGTIGHDGDDPGVSSFLLFNPKTGLGGIFLCNKYLADKTQVVKLLTQFVMGQ